MTVYGFHASHEQFPPSELLRVVEAAQTAGFTRAMCSDHFTPFSAEQGHSGFAWSWLGAATARTTLPMGVVNAPRQRYHPAMVAQAAATLTELFPGRFWLALGSGEALNEHITGERWPEKSQRNARYRDGGGGGPVLLQVHLSWAADDDTALRVAHAQWRTAILGSGLGWDLATPDDLDAATAHVQPGDMREHVLVSGDTAAHARWLHEYADLGIDEIYLHHVGRDQERFVDTFGAHVLPQLA